jgi:hypothetical protein
MSARLMVIAALLCPACATGSGPPPDDGKTTVQPGAKEDPRGDPATPSGAPADTPDAGTGKPAPSGEPPAGGDAHVDCQALWTVVDHLGCAVAKLMCAIFEAIPSAGAEVPCAVAVPVACGLTSTAAEAAEALCPR